MVELLSGWLCVGSVRIRLQPPQPPSTDTSTCRHHVLCPFGVSSPPRRVSTVISTCRDITRIQQVSLTRFRFKPVIPIIHYQTPKLTHPTTSPFLKLFDDNKQHERRILDWWDELNMMSTLRAARWRWLRRLQPNPVWDSLDLARLARHPLNDTSPESPPCNHHSNFSETENTFHAARHSSFLMEPGPTSNTGGHERQREQTRSTRRSMALTTSQRGDLYRLARFGSEPEREEASRLLLEDATAHLARLRSTATDSTGTPRTP